jgi:hypothetical protein
MADIFTTQQIFEVALRNGRSLDASLVALGVYSFLYHQVIKRHRVEHLYERVCQSGIRQQRDIQNLSRHGESCIRWKVRQR